MVAPVRPSWPWNNSQVVQNACRNMALKASKTQPDTPPNPLKSRPGAVPGTKTCPRSILDRPGSAQERPRSVQDAPKERPRGAKSRPKAPQSWPSGVQEAPNMLPDPSKIQSGEPQNEFVARSWWEAPFETHLERCCVVFCVRRKLAICEKPAKTWEKPWFFRTGSFCQE